MPVKKDNRDERLRKYRKLCREGSSCHVAARAVGCSYITMRGWERDAGYPPRKPGKRLKPMDTPSASQDIAPGQIKITTADGITIFCPGIDSALEVLAVLE